MFRDDKVTWGLGEKHASEQLHRLTSYDPVRDRAVSPSASAHLADPHTSSQLHALLHLSRPEMVDAALLRPGRLEQLLYVSYPTKDEREEVLRAHARSLPLSPRVLLPRLAERTERFSCAALAALCREAALQALARHTRKPTRRRGADLEADTRRASDTTPSDESTGDDTDDGTDDDGGDNEDNKDSDDGEGGGNSDDSDGNEDDGEPSLMRDGSQVALDHALTIRLIDLSRAARIVRRQQVLSPSAHAQMLQKFAAFARQ